MNKAVITERKVMADSFSFLFFLNQISESVTHIARIVNNRERSFFYFTNSSQLQNGEGPMKSIKAFLTSSIAPAAKIKNESKFDPFYFDFFLFSCW